jgi:hypothetical protein
MSNPRLSLKVIACEVAQREICHVAAKSRHLLSLEFLPVGYHEEPKQGHDRVQLMLDQLEASRFDAVLLGYGLCNQILNGLAARQVPLVVPRAHDCLTFFLGSRQRHEELHQACPGTFYFTAGWLDVPAHRALAREGAEAARQANDELASQQNIFTGQRSYAELVAKYGEDNARYLLEMSQQWSQSYERGLLIDYDFTASMGLGERVEAICRKRGWRFERIAGDLRMLERWVNGEWSETDFLVVAPGNAVYASFSDSIIESRPQKGTAQL